VVVWATYWLHYFNCGWLQRIGVAMNYIELAKQAGWDAHHAKFDTRIQTFAALVAAQEREECAKLCDDMDSASDYYGPRVELFCAEAIRARGEA
jgi:hypothetical protein